MPQDDIQSDIPYPDASPIEAPPFSLLERIWFLEECVRELQQAMLKQQAVIDDLIAQQRDRDK